MFNLYWNGKIKFFINKIMFGVGVFWLIIIDWFYLFSDVVCWILGSVGIIFFYSFNCFIIIVNLLCFCYLYFVCLFCLYGLGSICVWGGGGGGVIDYDLYG